MEKILKNIAHFDKNIQSIEYLSNFDATKIKNQHLKYEADVTLIHRHNQTLVFFTENLDRVTFSVTNCVEHLHEKFCEIYNVDDSFLFFEINNNWECSNSSISQVFFDEDHSPSWKSSSFEHISDKFNISYYDLIKNFYSNFDSFLSSILSNFNKNNFYNYLDYLIKNKSLSSTNFSDILEESLRTNNEELFNYILKYNNDNNNIIFNEKFDIDFYSRINYTDFFFLQFLCKKQPFLNNIDITMAEKHIEEKKIRDLIIKSKKISNF
jgi:hypothetical protein